MSNPPGEIIPMEEEDRESLRSFEDNLEERTTVTAIGKVKTIAGLDIFEQIFLAITTVNVVIAFGFTIDRLVNLPKDTPDYTFAIILFINIGFCSFYALHGVFRERECELYAYIGGIVVVLLYFIIDLAVNSRTPLKWGRFAAIIVFGFPNIGFGIKVALGSGDLAFKTIGASHELRRMYRIAGMYSSLLKFDFQFAISLAVLVIMNVAHLELHDKVTVGVGVPFQFAWSILGWFAMRKEMMILVKIFIPSSCVEPIYLIYRIIKVTLNWSENTQGDKKVLVYSFVAAVIVAFIVRGLVLVTLIFVVRNFAKGLKEIVFKLPGIGDKLPCFKKKGAQQNVVE